MTKTSKITTKKLKELGYTRYKSTMLYRKVVPHGHGVEIFFEHDGIDDMIGLTTDAPYHVPDNFCYIRTVKNDEDLVNITRALVGNDLE